VTLRHPDPFIDPTEGLDPNVNPYVSYLKQGLDSGELHLSYGSDMKRLRGNWKALFTEQMAATPKAIVCEVGCHKGNTICEMAAAHPDTAFIGVDITFKRVVTTARKAKDRGLKNVFSILANGRSLPKIFDANELDGLVVFFPDPWSKKKRQRKNRLFNTEFAKNMIPLLSDYGFVWFKSDQEDYVLGAREALENAGGQIIEKPDGILADTYTTTFELLFTKQNLPTFGFQWCKNGLQSARSVQHPLGNSALLGDTSPMIQLENNSSQRAHI
jgi:tRNA (guanine-N7-)-methyltransferase